MSYTVPALISAHTAIMTDLALGSLVILDGGGVTLATVTLADPSGVVDGGTGQLVFTVAAQEASAPATGTAATAELRKSDATVYRTFPCTEGTASVSGECVINSLNILAGTSVEVVSLVIG